MIAGNASLDGRRHRRLRALDDPAGQRRRRQRAQRRRRPRRLHGGQLASDTGVGKRGKARARRQRLPVDGRRPGRPRSRAAPRARRHACPRSVLDPGSGSSSQHLGTGAGPGARRAGRGPRRRQGRQRLQEAQPRLGHRRGRAHHRPQPRQPVGPGRSGRRRRRGWPTTGTDVSTLYSGGSARQHPDDRAARRRHPRRRADRDRLQPTSGFKVNGAPARFIFDSEAGTITAWNAGTAAPDRRPPRPDAIYKGLAIAGKGGATCCTPPNFHGGDDRRLQRRPSRR